MISKEQVMDVLRTINDPELNLNLVELGLIYGVEVSEQNEIIVKLTMTTPFCPYAPQILKETEDKLKAMPEVKEVKLELQWDPPWAPGMMDEEAKAKTGFDMYE
ncbi:MAG: metal-sulfur cluster assembly factor [Candidatus Diapherotrites archaeon]|nr:metal-sulfur cluster assembly factor [Candidatus Diapherotrites archaeon]